MTSSLLTNQAHHLEAVSHAGVTRPIKWSTWSGPLMGPVNGALPWVPSFAQASRAARSWVAPPVARCAVQEPRTQRDEGRVSPTAARADLPGGTRQLLWQYDDLGVLLENVDAV